MRQFKDHKLGLNAHYRDANARHFGAAALGYRPVTSLTPLDTLKQVSYIKILRREQELAVAEECRQMMCKRTAAGRTHVSAGS